MGELKILVGMMLLINDQITTIMVPWPTPWPQTGMQAKDSILRTLGLVWAPEAVFEYSPGRWL